MKILHNSKHRKRPFKQKALPGKECFKNEIYQKLSEMLSHVADKYLFCLQNINFQITYYYWLSPLVLHRNQNFLIEVMKQQRFGNRPLKWNDVMTSYDVAPGRVWSTETVTISPGWPPKLSSIYKSDNQRKSGKYSTRILERKRLIIRLLQYKTRPHCHQRKVWIAAL